MFKDIQNIITTLPANSFLCCFFICWLQQARKDARDWASPPKRCYTSIKKWLQQAREYVLIWLQLIFQRTSVISYCDVLLNVTWDVESFVFWDYDILDLICVILINGLKTYYVIWAEMLLWWMGWLFERVEIWRASLMGLKFYGLKCTLAATLAMSS